MFLVQCFQTFFALCILTLLACLAVLDDLHERFQRGTVIKDFKKLLYFLFSQGNPEYAKSVYDAAQLEGYEIEDHVVYTKDGYLLKLHRIKHTKGPTHGSVLLQHGLYQSSMLYLINKKENNLALVLVEQGYDVWLGNNRGNIHSRQHTEHCHSTSDFWAWCVDDLALDVKANIQYIRDHTPVSQPLFYIGHSQGSSQGLAAFSTDPEVRAQVDGFVALAPGAFVKPFSGRPLRFLSWLAHDHSRLFFALFGHQAFLPFMEGLRQYIPMIVFEYTAYVSFKYLFGWTDFNWDKSRRIAFFAETPAGTSARTVAHWMQQSRTGKFQKFCFNCPIQNSINYGTPEPPEYPIEKIDIPTCVIYGGKDNLLDFEQLIERLPNCISQAVEHHEHLDTIISTDAKILVFPTISRFFQSIASRIKVPCSCLEGEMTFCAQCA